MTVKFELDNGDAQYLIRSYSSTAVTVNDSTLHGSFVLMPDLLVPEWPPQCLAELTVADIELLLPYQPEVVLLGSGRRTQFPSSAIMRPLIGARIGYEVMDTQAACRGYAILAAEGRRVLAAMFPPGAM
jgi:uncharacterized protein